ncbi:LysR family transcriptional regulator [Leeia sp. TBRC 13508]|uniref:LysR family transcriptional regulator n=1 Tax=Leeia speluncae TaxID=2884804 RepID=A0ABS8DAJ7_9NEIS|nr:LysR family transcriptional regulator [Leeia speluncae]MCB6185225.1 LysR family transcriptional regulator [Leeia speluncae]
MNLKLPRTSAEQWRVLQAVVESGGFAQAAELLHKSQSAISYTVAKLQEQIGVALLEQDGRRMKLTEVGATLLRHAVPVVDGLSRLEQHAAILAQGWEAELHLAVEAIFPNVVLFQALARFAEQCPNTLLQVHEVVMSGADEAVESGEVDLVIASSIPKGYLGEQMLDASLVAFAAPNHPLHNYDRLLTTDDLFEHTQVVVRDSGTQNPRDSGWLGAKQRWTVSYPQTSIDMVKSGLAFAWLPKHLVYEDYHQGRLKPLPLRHGRERRIPLYLVASAKQATGPAARLLARCLLDAASAWKDFECPAECMESK